MESVEKETKLRVDLLEDEIKMLRRTMSLLPVPVAIPSAEVPLKRVVAEVVNDADTLESPPKKMRIVDKAGKFTSDFDGKVSDLLQQNLHLGSIMKIQPKLELELQELFRVSPISPLVMREVLAKLKGKRERLQKKLKPLVSKKVCFGFVSFRVLLLTFFIDGRTTTDG
jgi:hypothetical protein